MIASGIVSPSSAIDAYMAQSQGSDARQAYASPRQPQQASIIANLSTTGVLRSSLEDLQAKAQALKSLSQQSPNLQDFKVAVQGVVSSINNIRQSVAAAEADRNARRAVRNVEQSVFGHNNDTASTLRNAGLDFQNNGNLVIDQNKLDTALQHNRQGTLDAFSQLAFRVESAAGKQTQSNGTNGQKTNNLSQDQTSSNGQPVSEEAHVNAQRLAQQLASQQALASGYAARSAVASYFSVSSL